MRTMIFIANFGGKVKWIQDEIRSTYWHGEFLVSQGQLSKRKAGKGDVI